MRPMEFRVGQWIVPLLTSPSAVPIRWHMLQVLGTNGAASVLMHFGLGFLRTAIAPLSASSFQGCFGLWIQFRREVSQPGLSSNDGEAIRNVGPYMGCARAKRGLQSHTVASHLAAVADLYRAARYVKLDTQHFFIKMMPLWD